MGDGDGGGGLNKQTLLDFINCRYFFSCVSVFSLLTGKRARFGWVCFYDWSRGKRRSKKKNKREKKHTNRLHTASKARESKLT